jgi:hypothetical protein
LTVVAACGGKKLDLDAVRAVATDASVDHRPPVDALVARAAEADADLLSWAAAASMALGPWAASASGWLIAPAAPYSSSVIRDRKWGWQA